MARDRQGRPGNQEPVREGEAEHERDNEGCQAAHKGRQKTEGAEPDLREDEASTRIKVFITARRVRIDPERKRTEYIHRLEALIQGLDGIIADPEGVEKIQLRAMDVMIRAVNMCYRIVRDVDVEMMEDELARIEEENQRAREGEDEQGVGYEIEEDPAP